METFCVSDFSKIFKYRFVHLGGDEVDTSKLTCSDHCPDLVVFIFLRDMVYHFCLKKYY